MEVRVSQPHSLATLRDRFLPLSSRGLGRRPLTAETGVRIPVAVPHEARPQGGFRRSMRNGCSVVGPVRRDRWAARRRTVEGRRWASTPERGPHARQAAPALDLRRDGRDRVLRRPRRWHRVRRRHDRQLRRDRRVPAVPGPQERRGQERRHRRQPGHDDQDQGRQRRHQRPRRRRGDDREGPGLRPLQSGRRRALRAGQPGRVDRQREREVHRHPRGGRLVRDPLRWSRRLELRHDRRRRRLRRGTAWESGLSAPSESSPNPDAVVAHLTDVNGYPVDRAFQLVVVC